MKQSENQMGTKAIFPLLMGMSVPPMISMLIQSLYNIVDSIFVAKLGDMYSFDIFYFAWNLFYKTIFADVHR